MLKKTKINKKRPGLAHFFKKMLQNPREKMSSGSNFFLDILKLTKLSLTNAYYVTAWQ